jgi:hypothetical protein
MVRVLAFVTQPIRLSALDVLRPLLVWTCGLALALAPNL